MGAETRIERCGPMELVGVAVHGDTQSGPEDRAWGLFGATANEASVSRVGKDIFGLHIYHPRFPNPPELTYVACLVKKPGMEVPIRMIAKSLPECRYAVQKAVGGIMGIGEAFASLYEDYIPSHDLQVAMPIDFEKYCNVESHDKVPEDIEVWVPIKDA